ncbi:MAG TPA: UDP-N-acetylmuramoyl-L-alanine--D-glutamate ligase [Candidatus Paceibacterota bacterium]|nr:UDP-N-acetylmuramoyl-L-alanine--D-glutamate ligase [Candidatus Paceibacterota bacterium]
MSHDKDYFKGKKITVMGLGLLGRGVGDTAFLAECGAEIIVTDLKDKEQLADSLKQLEEYTTITYRLGEHREEDFRGRDMILKAAGVPLDSPYIHLAHEDGAEIAMSGALLAKLSGVPIIGVTGTRGKSTVTHMIHHVLTHATEGGKVLLGGNVRGVSNLQLLKEVEDDTLIVMELDSWQLQGFGTYEISPHISVFTNFMEDHLNYYGGDMDAYFKDKANIFRFQEESNVFVTTREVFERARAFAQKEGFELNQDIKIVDTSLLPDDCVLAIPGEHNRLNAALALEALRAIGLTDEEIFQWLGTFTGVPGRLEYIGEVKGIKVYNDATATSPDAVIVALETLGLSKNIVLILGGVDKGFKLDKLVASVNVFAREVIFLPGNGTDRLIDHIQNSDSKIYETLEDAVSRAFLVCRPGDILLLSPGFSSKNIFKNEYDRYDQFNAIVAHINE